MLPPNVKSEQNKTWKDNPAVSEQNKTWKDNPAVSWIVSPLSGKYDTYNGESMCRNWFLNEARYVLRPGACFRHGVKEIKPVPAQHTCFHNLEQLAERANTRCDVTNLIKWLPSRQDQHEIEQETSKTTLSIHRDKNKARLLLSKLQYSRLVWGGCGCWVTWVT